MRTVFEHIHIERILFQTDANEALMQCITTQNGEEIPAELMLSSSALNQLMAKLIVTNAYADIEELFHVEYFPDGSMEYRSRNTCSREENQEPWMDIFLRSDVKQICA